MPPRRETHPPYWSALRNLDGKYQHTEGHGTWVEKIRLNLEGPRGELMIKDNLWGALL
jgi:hypothetical protein